MLAEIMGVKRPGSVVVPYGIRFIDAKMLFEKIIQQQLSAIGKTYKVEAENYEKIDELIKYFIGEPGKLNPNKGVYLYGAVGRGKTRVMEAIMVMCNTIEKRLEANDMQFTSRKFQLKNAKSIVVELGESKSAQTIKKYYTGPLCIDDMGSEDSFKLWGNDMNVVGDIVVERYQRYQQSGLLTHATSNTLPTEWTKKYGERVESRLNEMFNVVVLLGQDKRKD
jgi:DNA replication protein DnaC